MSENIPATFVRKEVAEAEAEFVKTAAKGLENQHKANSPQNTRTYETMGTTWYELASQVLDDLEKTNPRAYQANMAANTAKLAIREQAGGEFGGQLIGQMEAQMWALVDNGQPLNESLPGLAVQAISGRNKNLSIDIRAQLYKFGLGIVENSLFNPQSGVQPDWSKVEKKQSAFDRGLVKNTTAQSSNKKIFNS